MGNSYKIIDVEKWKRKIHLQFKCSPMPWVKYTHISHTNSGKKDNATPLFDWGKYYEEDGKIMMPFSVQVHHSFVDGIHVGRFVEVLQEYLNNY